MTLCDGDGVIRASLALPRTPQLASGKWYAFPEKTVWAFPGKQRGYLSADVQSNIAVEATVTRAKYVGTLDLCLWFPRQEVAGTQMAVQGIDEVCSPEDVLIFLQVPPVSQRIDGQIWIAFALHSADVNDLTLDHHV